MSVSTPFKYLGINISLSKFSEIYLNEILRRQTQFPKLVGPYMLFFWNLELTSYLFAHLNVYIKFFTTGTFFVTDKKKSKSIS